MAKVIKKQKEEIKETPGEEKVIPAEIPTNKPTIKNGNYILHFPDSFFCAALNKKYKKGVYNTSDKAEYEALKPFHKDAPINGFVVNTK